jgi:acyl-CoA synthetase (AMP-forming)/AMP-acid ligase II
VPAAARANLLGMTESFGPYCGDRLDQPLPAGKEGSCGRAFEGIELRIVDVDTSTPLGPDELGEIQLRGPNLMRGICGRTRTEVFTVDEFYPTGDLGRLDADGYLYLAGRRDDMFKVRGATVYPSEVERALHGIRGVRRAYVVDIVHDGSTAVAAAVIAVPDRALTVDALEREARARLSAFKVPTRWRLVTDDEVPMAATGKVDKAGLQQLFGDETSRERAQG